MAYRRERYNPDFVPDWTNIDLGTLPDRAVARRLVLLLGAVGKIIRHRKLLRTANSAYAINLDLAFLALIARTICGSWRHITYEVADIHPRLVASSPASAGLRWLERRVLARCSLLVTTSPGFLQHWFEEQQGYAGRSYLLENRLYPRGLPARETVGTGGQQSDDRADPGRWTIGWFGALRCERTLELIRSTAIALPDEVTFYLRGAPTIIEGERFRETVNALPNIVWEGIYRHPDDLAEIYSRIDVMLGFELVHEAHNSRWLLPNRLYEAGYFNTPLIAPEQFQVGRYIATHGIGWLLEAPLQEHLVSLIRSLEMDEYRRVVAAISALPAEMFASRELYADLGRTIRDLPPPPASP